MKKIIEAVPGNTFGYKNMYILDKELWSNAVHDMDFNNTYCPDIVRVIYNIGTKAYPKLDDNGKRVKNDKGEYIFLEPVKVLTTVVFFKDGTKVSVTNSEKDGVMFEDAMKETVKITENGKKEIIKESRGFKIATTASKEMGLVYAIVKRMIGKPDKNGTILGNGLGRKLNKVVSEAYDTDLEEVNRREAAAAAKAKYEATKGTSKRKPRISLSQAVDNMSEILEKLNAKLG